MKKPAPHLQLGVIWEELGEVGKAENKYRDITKRFPQTEYASSAERRLEGLSGKETGGIERDGKKSRSPLNF